MLLFNQIGTDGDAGTQMDYCMPISRFIRTKMNISVHVVSKYRVYHMMRFRRQFIFGFLHFLYRGHGFPLKIEYYSRPLTIFLKKQTNKYVP